MSGVFGPDVDEGDEASLGKCERVTYRLGHNVVQPEFVAIARGQRPLAQAGHMPLRRRPLTSMLRTMPAAERTSARRSRSAQLPGLSGT